MEFTIGVLNAYTDKLTGTKEYDWKQLDGLKKIEQPSVSYADHSFVLDVAKRMSGRMLTLIEASISDKEQRKALKDMVKGFFSEEMNHVSDLMFSQEYMNNMCQKATDEAPQNLQSIDIEEIIRA